MGKGRWAQVLLVGMVCNVSYVYATYDDEYVMRKWGIQRIQRDKNDQQQDNVYIVIGAENNSHEIWWNRMRCIAQILSCVTVIAWWWFNKDKNAAMRIRCSIPFLNWFKVTLHSSMPVHNENET